MNALIRMAGLGLVLSCWFPTPTQAAPTNAPRARRILFLGDSITYSGQYVEYFEAVLRAQFRDWPGEVLNLGLPSETVSGLSEVGHADGAFPRPDLSERLDRVLGSTKPDLVIACYGMNDGIYLPFDDVRFQRFQDGIRRLHEAALAAGASCIHVTPPTFEPAALPGGAAPSFDYNDVLDRYSEWLLGQRAQGWVVLDVHGLLNRHLAERRQREPGYRLAGDGVHPGEAGHWLIAAPILAHFGVSIDAANNESAEAFLAQRANGVELLRLVQKRQRLLKDAWLTETGHKRPGMTKGLPLSEAKARTAEWDVQIRALLHPAGQGG